MKRKIIALLSACMLCIPFITPVYAETTYYWSGLYAFNDGNIQTIDLATANVIGGYRYRFKIAPSFTGYYVGNGTVKLVEGWYVGKYSSTSIANSYAQLFQQNLSTVYMDTIDNNSAVTRSYGYTPGTNNNTRRVTIQDGTQYRIYVVNSYNNSFTGGAYYKKGLPIVKNIDSSITPAIDSVSCLKVLLGLATTADGWGSSTFGYSALLSVDDMQAHQVVGAIYNPSQSLETALGESNLPDSVPENGYGDGGNANSGSGSGSGSSSSSGSTSSSNTTIEEGAISQQQQQYIEEGAISNNTSATIEEGAISNNTSATIEQDAVNVTVNNNDGLKPETVNALDGLLENQGINTSFNEAISNINGFRQLGVAFAGTVSVFLGWLPAWVISLLGLMFTLLFFFIILRLLKVFHG